MQLTPDAAPPAPGWQLGNLQAEAPQHGHPSPLIFILHVLAPREALENWSTSAHASMKSLIASLTTIREGSSSLSALRRAEAARTNAEQTLSDARRRAAQARHDISVALRDDHDPTAAEEAQTIAERDIRRGEERLRVLQGIEADARTSAQFALESEIEGGRKKLQAEIAEKLATVDAAIAAAISPLLVKALILRRDLALLSVPATKGFSGQSAFADLSVI